MLSRVINGLSKVEITNQWKWDHKNGKKFYLTPKIPCGFSTKLGSFGHSWRNHFPPKIKFKK
jgi:hypothetical protein